MKQKDHSASKAVLFDMDGVLVDNHSFHVAAWNEFCSRHGKQLTEEEFNSHVNGHTIQSVIRYLFGSALSPQETEALGEEKEAIYRRRYAPHMQPVPGLESFLMRLQQAGWQLAVATSAPTKNLHFVLKGLKIEKYFTVCVDSTGVKNGKPAPDIYLKAAEALNMPAKRCIVIEDSLAGIAAGQAAGMAVIALTTTHTAEELAPTAVRWMYDSFKEIKEQQLEKIIDEDEG